MVQLKDNDYARCEQIIGKSNLLLTSSSEKDQRKNRFLVRLTNWHPTERGRLVMTSFVIIINQYIHVCFQFGAERMMDCYSEKLREITSRDELSQRSEKVARLM